MTSLRPIAWVLRACAALFCTLTLSAQVVEDVREFNPSDIYMQAWLLVRDGEQAEGDKDPLEAFNKYQKATRLFDSVALYYPDWKPNLVHDRRELTVKSMESLRPQAEAAQREQQKKTEALLEGPGQFTPQPASTMQALTPAERQQVQSLQARIQALTNDLKRAETDRDANALRLRRTLDELKSERDSLAQAPVQQEIAELNGNITRLQQERDAMAQALRQSRLEQQNTLADVARLQTDTKLAQEKAAQIQETLITERNIGNSVVQGLRKQLSETNAKMEDLQQRLSVANQRNESLTAELAEARAEIGDLREERDSLIRERDQMAALLKMNESDRVKALIEENMSLGRDLNEARGRLQALFNDNNTTKDALTEAKRDLAVAKARIMQLSKQNDEQTQRLADLEARLSDEAQSLVNAGSAKPGASDAESMAGSSEEISMLRSIITRQLRVQDRRRQAKELLIEEVNRLELNEPGFNSALSIFSAQEMKLSKEEEELLADQKIDGEFVFNDYVPARERAQNNRRLQQSIQVQTDAAHRAFANGRYMASREVFESILLEHPGHVPTKIKLGIVHMRLRDHVLAIGEFSESIAIRGPFAYANFMLGAAHYEMRELSKAREHLAESLEMDPENAKAHIYLGVIAGDESQIQLAETHFQEAISLDPTLSDPYYNLSRIYQQRGSRTKALEYYQKAIMNGGDPDVDFERQLGS